MALVLFVLLAVSSSGESQSATGKRTIPCKTPTNAATCYWTRGRLSLYNGAVNIRLWKIGTNRLLGIHGGPSVFRRDSDDAEEPELPANVSRVFDPLNNQIFADFEICPLEPERPGAMQAACIESAKNIRVEKSDQR